MLWYLVAIVLLLALSAAFSGSETALFSLTPAWRDRINETRPATGRRLERLLSNPRRLLGTIILANQLVNITASSLFTLLVISYTQRYGYESAIWLGVGGLVMTAVLLVFGEVTPKVLATHRPGAFVTATGPLITAARTVLAPAVWLLIRVSSGLAPRSGEPDHMTEEELHTMIRVGKERGVIAAREEEILWNLVGLEERTASEIMTPRIDMVCLERDRMIRDARQTARESGFSRLPIYEGTVDNVVGVCYAKELLTAPDETAPVQSVSRPAYFVPETKRLTTLLEELRRKGSHITVVVDEFGQTAGLLTLEDVLEAIFGEISDEFDQPAEELPYFKLKGEEYVVDGDIDIATLDRLFGGAFGDVEDERLAGYIHERLGRLANQGDRLNHAGVEIVVQEVEGNKLERVLVRKAGTGESGGD